MAHNAHTKVLCGGCLSEIDLKSVYGTIPTRTLTDRVVYFCRYECESMWLKKQQARAVNFPTDSEQLPLSHM
jgi:hypothetical protein